MLNTVKNLEVETSPIVDGKHSIAGLFDIFLRGRVERQPNILGHLNEIETRRVMQRVQRRRYKPKDILFCQGDGHDGIFMIESGLVRTYYNSPSGREITLAYWEPGNFVGGPDVFGDSIHVWSGVAVHETEVNKLSGTALRELMAKIPGLGIGVAEALVFKGKCFSSLVQMLGTRSVRERLSQLLLMLMELHGQPGGNGAIVISQHFTHEDLAHMVGASRQWVTTTLDRLQDMGIVEVRTRQVVVLKPDLLTRASGG